MSRVKIAIIGVGNCASSLIQGIHFYSENKCTDGLINPIIHGMKVSDIEVVAAFDVDEAKVGKDLSKAIFSSNNNAMKLTDIPFMDVIVTPAPVLDGIGDNYSSRITNTVEANRDDVFRALKLSGAEVLVNYLPVGSREATRFWADIALEAKCAFINCIPEFIASEPTYASKFKAAGIPLLGDDIKSQFGATLLHRIIVQHMELRGFTIDRTYQLNYGGNMDFYNMLDCERLTSKKISKREAVKSIQKNPIENKYVHIGPSGYIEWLEDNKWCYIHIIGRGFGGAPIKIETKLEVCDSPNSAGVVVDLVRIAKKALRNEIGGVLEDVCAFYMKSPPKSMDDDLALRMLNNWLKF